LRMKAIKDSLSIYKQKGHWKWDFPQIWRELGSGLEGQLLVVSDWDCQGQLLFCGLSRTIYTRGEDPWMTLDVFHKAVWFLMHMRGPPFQFYSLILDYYLPKPALLWRLRESLNSGGSLLSPVWEDQIIVS
jgi:hypothetical protein